MALGLDEIEHILSDLEYYCGHLRRLQPVNAAKSVILVIE